MASTCSISNLLCRNISYWPYNIYSYLAIIFAICLRPYAQHVYLSRQKYFKLYGLKYESCYVTMYFDDTKKYLSYIYFFFPFLLQPMYLSKLSIKIMGTCFATNTFLFIRSTQNDKFDVSNILACDIIAQKDFEVFSCIVCKNLTFLLFVSHKDRIRCAKVVKRKAIWWRLESTPYGLHAAIQFMLTRVSKFKSSSVFNVQHGWNALCKQIATKKIL